jgi:hypothetical protein
MGASGSVALGGLDRARRAALSLALASRPLGFVLRRRARRIEARAVIAIVVALALAVLAPALMLALGPIVFGVPHAASEVRYLVVRRGLGRGFLVAVVIGCVVMSGLRLTGQLRGEPVLFARLEVAAGAAWIAGGALLAARRPGALRRLAWLAPILAAAALLAVQHATAARLVFVHLHNFGALLLWVVFFRRRAGVPVLALALLAGAVALLLSGVTVAWSARLGALTALDVDVARVAAWLAPDVGLALAVALALVHAFSDSVHYTTWLGVIPEEEVRAEGSLTFRMTLRSLLADFGKAGVAAVAVMLAVVVGGSLVNLTATRGVYFSLAGFHGYLELAVLAYLVAAGEARPAGGVARAAPGARPPRPPRLAAERP